MAYIGMFVILMVTSCQTVVTHSNIQLCRLFCESRSGIYRLIVDPIKGVGCHCKNSDLLWLEIDERGPFQDRLDIDEDLDLGADIPES